MADEKKKITVLTQLITPAVDDYIPIVDKSDTTQAASGTTKYITPEDLDKIGATELTIASDAITVTQKHHKLQPQSSTADDLSTISGTTNGQSGVLYASDYGTDTITIKHNVGNIICPGAADITLSNGCVFWYSDGTKVYMSGGGGGGASIGRNAIINGSFRVSQRGTTFISTSAPANSDDTYLLDRWILLSDGNDIVDVSQEQSATITDPAYNIKLDVETGNKKFGILTILEQNDSRQLINQTVSLSFKAKITGTTINAIRAAILTWSSTADTVTSDVVNAWGGAGTNPTLVANWNYENTPDALAALTTSWQTFKIENITVDTAAATNIAVFIWTDDATMDVGDFLHITDVQLEIGSTATAIDIKPYQLELLTCQRYYFKTNYASGATIGIAYQQSTTVINSFPNFPIAMRGIPALASSAYTTWAFVNAGSDVAATSINYLGGATPINCQFAIDIASTGSANHASNIRVLSGQTGYLSGDAEL